MVVREEDRMTAISANLEWLFTEATEGIGDRVRAAAAAGVRELEIWGWRSKDIPDLAAALEDTGARLLTLLVDPPLQLTDPATHDEFVQAVGDSRAVAERLASPNLVVVAGDERTDVPRSEQRANIVTALTRGAAELEGSSVRLLLENLNSRVDHRGTYLSLIREGLDIIKEVGSPHLHLLLDAYHAAIMEEDLTAAIGDDIALIGHVQVADAPGRHEPGTGEIDWSARLRELRRLGYTGSFGMEYVPTTGSAASLAEIIRIVDQIDRSDDAQ
jgi:hydroxypyruvate isomerase